MANLTNALVADWEQIPAARWKALQEEWRLLYQNIKANGLGKKC